MALTNDQIVEVLTELSPDYPDWGFRVYYNADDRLFWAIEPFEGTFAPITVGFNDVADHDELNGYITGALKACADYLNPIALSSPGNLGELNQIGVGQEDTKPGELI